MHSFENLNIVLPWTPMQTDADPYNWQHKFSTDLVPVT